MRLQITAPDNIQVLWKKWKRREKMTVDSVIELFQFLLDTNQHLKNPHTKQVAEYFIMEGFCYHVPTS